jgi:phosphoenolpyruvate synthase/pyruvate phosphate dikinase
MSPFLYLCYNRAIAQEIKDQAATHQSFQQKENSAILKECQHRVSFKNISKYLDRVDELESKLNKIEDLQSQIKEEELRNKQLKAKLAKL